MTGVLQEESRWSETRGGMPRDDRRTDKIMQLQAKECQGLICTARR